MAKLIISIDQTVRNVSVVKTPLMIGRHPSSDVVLEDLTVSGSHAVIHSLGDTAYIEDVGSRNGTRVNGVRIRNHALEDADVISIGQYTIEFSASESPELHGQIPNATLQGWTNRVPAKDGEKTLRMPVPAADDSRAMIRTLSGSEAGNNLPLQKVVTIIGQAGGAKAALAHRLEGYVVVPIDGPVTLNGALIHHDMPLADGDMLKVGESHMQFSCP